jgi:acetyl esterase/lipase
VDVVDLPSGAGARLYRPTAAAAPTAALLWIHGGGYLLGSPEQAAEMGEKAAAFVARHRGAAKRRARQCNMASP